jgi:hypothetical protein
MPEMFEGNIDFTQILEGLGTKVAGEDVEVPGGNPFYVFDDILVDKDKDWIEDTVLNSMEWYYNGGTTKYKIAGNDPKIKETHQFVHSLIAPGVPNSRYAELIDPIILNIEKQTNMKVEEIQRVKANLLLNYPNWDHSMYHPPHVDIEDPTQDESNWLSMVYYVNDSDGDTYFFDTRWGEETDDMTVIGQCNPKKGRAVVFHSNRYHASSCPVNSNKRIVLNFAMKVREK